MQYTCYRMHKLQEDETVDQLKDRTNSSAIEVQQYLIAEGIAKPRAQFRCMMMPDKPYITSIYEKLEFNSSRFPVDIRWRKMEEIKHELTRLGYSYRSE